MMSDAASTGRTVLLAECLLYAIGPHQALDQYLKSIFGEDGPGGGDPGWWIVWVDSEADAIEPVEWRDFVAALDSGDGCFEVYLDETVTDRRPTYGYFTRCEIYSGIEARLRSICKDYPERRLEAERISMRLTKKTPVAGRSCWMPLCANGAKRYEALSQYLMT